MGVTFSFVLKYAGDSSKSICLVKNISKESVIQVVKRNGIKLKIRKP